MRKYIAISIATACIISTVSADNLENIPMAKTYSIDDTPIVKKVEKVSNTKVVKKEVVKKAKKMAKKVVVKGSNEDLASEIKKLKKKIKKLDKKINVVKAHDAYDNIKWSVDFRTSMDNLNYDMADGSTKSNDSLFALKLYLDMAYAVDSHNIFKGQLAMNKAFGADFGATLRSDGLASKLDWTSNESLSDNNLKVKEAYWLYLGDNLFGSDLGWTLSIGRRPSVGGFLVNYREDDIVKSPLGHHINLEFDGLSTMLKLEDITKVSGMSFKLCVGRGSTDAVPMFDMKGEPSYVDHANGALDDINMVYGIFVPYNDGQYKIMSDVFMTYNLLGMDNPASPNARQGFYQYGDMQGSALSVLVDGLVDDGYLSNVKLFGSFAWSKTLPDDGNMMLGSSDDETGTSYWFGTLLPVTDDSILGLEYNHGSKYWRSLTYGEDTMIGSKLAARGDVYEGYYTYKINKAFSAQFRYTYIDYDYTGSNGFFGNYSGVPLKISDIKSGKYGDQMKSQIVESAQDLRIFIKYKF